MNSHNDEFSIFEADVKGPILDKLNSLELVTLSKTSRKMNKIVWTYVYAMLEPYGYSHYESSPYCKTSKDYNKNLPTPDLEHAKRALVLAVKFNPANMTMILKLHPEIISCVLETRTVTITDPITKQSFTALWHFKLSHLLATADNTMGLMFLRRVFSDQHKDYKNKISQFFSEPICWESSDSNGSKGPTPLFIAVLYDNGGFFNEITNESCVLTLEEGFDQPYNQINPCYIALQQLVAAKTQACFNTLFNFYVYSPSAPMIQECVNIIFSQAIKGDYTFLNILLNLQSDRLEAFLESGLFMALEANNMEVVKLISRKIEDFSHIYEKDQNSLLTIATQKSLKDPNYLPMVKHFLCCGCLPTEAEIELLDEHLINSSHTMFNNDNSIKKQIRHYFKVTVCFNDFLRFCQKANPGYLYFSVKKERDPVEVLLTTASLDKTFFNELVVSLLKNGDEWMLNKKLGHLDVRKRFYICLLNFANNHQDAHSLTADTLEEIGDNLISDRESLEEAYCEDDIDALTMASRFYNLAIAELAIVVNGNPERVLQKLQDMEAHNKPTSKYTFKK